MARTIRIAAVQMNARPARVSERLGRAKSLIAEAASKGAQLIVLPEAFNTGYEYSDENYYRAEPIDGPTGTWMKQVAAESGVHLAGAFLLLDHEDIYNSLCLVAPDGHVWRYDKNYPWAWERAYFRDGHGITVADTVLGKLGMLICWDIAHPELWQRYAGKIDAMLICSCPPAVHDLTFHLPDGLQVRSDELGPPMRRIKRTSDEAFGHYLRRQSSHLGVPMANTTGTGRFYSAVPLPKISLFLYGLMCPRLWKYIPTTEALFVETGYFNETYIADADGRIVEKAPTGNEGYALGEVILQDSPPQPSTPPPAYGLSTLVYLFDNLANLLLIPVYRRGVRRAYGRGMAPISQHPKTWLMLTLAGILIAFFLGRVLGRRDAK